MKERVHDPYRRSRMLYCAEATLEYLISILVGETYLAKIAKELGASDALTGVLYSFVSLGCAFQLISVFLSGKTPVKRWATMLHIVNQLFFTFVYAVPLFELSRGVKLAFFVVMLLLGQILNNVVNPVKIHWFMALVDDKKRGRFTANKEMISLITGMVFSFVMGNVIDRVSERGEMRTAFLIGCVTMFSLTLLHTLTLIFSKEKSVPKKNEKMMETVRLFLKNKMLFRVIGVSALWYAVNYVTTPFFGSYRIGELGFTMTFCSVLAIVTAVVRTIFSRPMGIYADRHGFARMLMICFSVQGVALAVHIFTVPSNGAVFSILYCALNAVAMAGINSAQINLIYDYVEPAQRMSALAISQAIAGVIGFLCTLAVTPLVNTIQGNGNTLFGIPMYAQQLLSVIGVLGILGILIYIVTVLKISENSEKNEKGE